MAILILLCHWRSGCREDASFDLGGYISGQLLGAIIGSLLVVLVWGRRAASVGYGTTVPGAGHPLWMVFLAEVSLTFLLVFSIFVFVSSHRLMRWTPLMVWLLVAVMVWLEAPISGYQPESGTQLWTCSCFLDLAFPLALLGVLLPLVLC